MRKLRYTIPFVSLNGTQCEVRVYIDGYTGEPSVLTPAATPFEYEEDASTDLLQFVRVKTGYLRVIEHSQGELAQLHSTSLQSHYIEAWYGDTLTFTGYIQPQGFEGSWHEYPREIELPVTSPLGLINDLMFDPMEPGTTTLGNVIYAAIEKLAAAYNRVIWPRISQRHLFGLNIPSCVIAPFNESFAHYDDTAALRTSQPLSVIFEGICSWFGWVLHDTPHDIIFAQPDHEKEYNQQPVPALINKSFVPGGYGYGATTNQFVNYFANPHADAIYEHIMAAKKIELKMAGSDNKSVALSTRYTQLPAGNLYTVFDGMVVQPLQNASSHMSSQYADVALFYTSGEIYQPEGQMHIYPLSIGYTDKNSASVSMSEQWLTCYDTDWLKSNAWQNQPVMEFRVFDNMPNSGGWVLLKLKIEVGAAIRHISGSNISRDRRVRVNISSGNVELYNDSAIIEAGTGRVLPNMQDAASKGLADFDGIIFSIKERTFDQPVTIRIYLTQDWTGATIGNLNPSFYIRWAELSLNEPGFITELFDQRNARLTSVDVKPSHINGIEEKSVDVKMQNYPGGCTQFSPDYLHFQYWPKYQYMFEPLDVVTHVCEQKVQPPYEYTGKFNYWSNGWQCRILAHSFNLIDDEHQITIYRINKK